MNQIPIKLGPLALLLTVIATCLTVLAMLTFSTASADKAMAERYALSVQVRYELDQKGQSFLREADDMLAKGKSLSKLSGVRKTDGIYEKTIEDKDYTLTVGVSEQNGKCQLKSWTLEKKWKGQTQKGKLWTGQ